MRAVLPLSASISESCFATLALGGDPTAFADAFTQSDMGDSQSALTTPGSPFTMAVKCFCAGVGAYSSAWEFTPRLQKPETRTEKIKATKNLILHLH